MKDGSASARVGCPAQAEVRNAKVHLLAEEWCLWERGRRLESTSMLASQGSVLAFGVS